VPAGAAPIERGVFCIPRRIGYGADALRTLVQHLFEVFSTLEVAIIGAHPANARHPGL
jgi:hypothetical protein